MIQDGAGRKCYGVGIFKADSKHLRLDLRLILTLRCSALDDVINQDEVVKVIHFLKMRKQQDSL